MKRPAARDFDDAHEAKAHKASRNHQRQASSMTASAQRPLSDREKRNPSRATARIDDAAPNGRRQPVNKLNDLSAKEWLPETVSVWIQRGLGKSHAHAEIERQHPAPFSFQDVARLVRFFTKAGETVLDPFAGVGSTLKAAALEGRRGIGIELNKKYADLTKTRLKTELPKGPSVCREQAVLKGDARKLLPTLPENTVKLVVTSPPYWTILHKQDHKAIQERVANGLDTQYSEDPADLGNIPSYATFLSTVADTLALTRPLLVDGGHMCVVVGDFRQKSRYYMFHADIATEMEKRGFTLKGIKVLYQRHKRVFPYGFPYSYVPNLHHQYIVILAK
jgi:DNA modification methylase